MKRNLPKATAALAMAFHLALAALAIGDDPAQPAAGQPLPSATEARGRAKLLHETLHATLQAVHHHYFREDEKVPIPAATLRDVFREVARRQGVELRWLAVNAQAMNVDHLPRDDFEKNAAKAIAAGEESYEQAEHGVYRRAGAITLTSDCLKCHLPHRTSTKSRAAALVIRLPIEEQ